MNVQADVAPVHPELEYTNCCQPIHADGLAAPSQGGTFLLLFWKKFVLSWSEKELGVPESFSLVTPVTLSKDPSAKVIKPDETWAAQSVPLPTVSPRAPRAGG